MPGSYHTPPQTVVKRLPIYLRVLDNLLLRGVEIISSKELSTETGFTPEQIRKDLAYFGAFGTRGTGYQTSYLRDKILKIIGLDQKTPIIIVGAGHLGIALTRYNITNNPYVQVLAVFDKDPEVIGEKVLNVEILPVSEMARVIKEHGIKVAILTVPAKKAQEVAGELVSHGIRAILNFAPIKIEVPQGVQVHNADITIELQSLIYYSNNEKERLSRLKEEKQVNMEENYEEKDKEERIKNT